MALHSQFDARTPDRLPRGRWLALLLLFIAVLTVLASTAPYEGDGGPSRRGTVVDQIAAEVDNQAITENEVEDAARFARLSAALNTTGAPEISAPAPLTQQEYGTALHRSIDLRLLQIQRRADGYPAASAREVSTQYEHLVKLAGGPVAWAGLLAKYQLTGEEVKASLRQQLSIVSFLNGYFRLQLAIAPADIQQYYAKVFVPAAQRQHLSTPPLATVRTQIREILQQRRLQQLQARWLTALRTNARIQIEEPDAPKAAPEGAQR